MHPRLKKTGKLYVSAVLAFSLSLAAERPAAPAPPELGAVLGIRGAAVAEINQVQPGSVAESLGLAPGDLVMSFNGHPIREFNDVGSFLGELRLAAHTDKAVVDILKHDPGTDSYASQQVTAVLRGTPDDPKQALLGFLCGLSYIVLEVLPAGPGHRMGLNPGDFIEEINGQRVGQLHSAADIDRVVQDGKTGASHDVSLLVMHWEYPENGKKVGVNPRRIKSAL